MAGALKFSLSSLEIFFVQPWSIPITFMEAKQNKMLSRCGKYERTSAARNFFPFYSFSHHPLMNSLTSLHRSLLPLLSLILFTVATTLPSHRHTFLSSTPLVFLVNFISPLHHSFSSYTLTLCCPFWAPLWLLAVFHGKLSSAESSSFRHDISIILWSYWIFGNIAVVLPILFISFLLPNLSILLIHHCY